MPKRLVPLTVEEHEALAVRLIKLREELFQIANIAGPAYGAAMTDLAWSPSRQIDKLRSKLDDRWCAEHEEESPYYGKYPHGEAAVLASP